MLAIKPSGRLTVSPGSVAPGDAAFFAPADGYRVYLDGSRVSAAPVIAAGDTSEHVVEFYGKGESKPWACRIVRKAGQLRIVPTTPGPEPVP